MSKHDKTLALVREISASLDASEAAVTLGATATGPLDAGGYTGEIRALPGRQIVTIGAAAFRWHYPTFRGTLDLDLCITIDLEEHTRSDLLPRGWTRVQGMPHRWRFLSEGVSLT